MKRIQVENEKYIRKIEILNHEYQDLQMGTAKRIMMLETQVNQLTATLSSGKLTSNGFTPPTIVENTVIGSQESVKVERLETKVRTLNDLLQKSKQPQQSLLQEIHEKESELHIVRQQLTTLTSEQKYAMISWNWR